MACPLDEDETLLLLVDRTIVSVFRLDADRECESVVESLAVSSFVGEDNELGILSSSNVFARSLLVGARQRFRRLMPCTCRSFRFCKEGSQCFSRSRIYKCGSDVDVTYGR